VCVHGTSGFILVLGQGIVIEFTGDSGLIKCSQNPQLYFRMAEVIVKKHNKKLELNEKVEFSVVPVSSVFLVYSVLLYSALLLGSILQTTHQQNETFQVKTKEMS